MATLKNVTISDNGYMRLPQGTNAQRPSVPTVTLSATFKGLTIARDGLQLYIAPVAPGVATNTWLTYTGLPDYLKGLQCTFAVNETNGANITFSDLTRVYMMRDPSWTAVDTTGWTTVETGKNYIPSYNLSVFYKDFAAGTYSFNNNSAMYFFSPLAAGTTTSVGAMRYNTSLQVNEVWTGAEWKTLGFSTVTATGGTQGGSVTTVGGYKIHTFTSNGTFIPTFSGTVDIMVIAGGGCGAGLGGGGGAGGYQYITNYQVISGFNYSIQVGTGGPGPASHSPGSGATGGAGNPSFFNGSGPQGIVSTGGGHGGYWTGPASPGGSGGGGPGYNYNPGTRPAGNGIQGQGHPGGFGHHGGGPASNLSPQPGICVYGGGGGGGAGEKGFERKSWGTEVKGGNGMANWISGTNTYYAGGGAGGSHGPSGNYARDRGVGGLGGGGGSGSGGPQSFLDARPGTGSGGGGAWHPDTFRSGNGASGIVIVRYKS
jgi:hypothetical protein